MVGGSHLLNTAVTRLLGLEYPILQGGMAWVAQAELAAAVSEAGGLGIIGAGNMPAAALREEIERARQLTKKPFGVNVMLMSPHAEQVLQLVSELRVPVVTTGAGNPGPYVASLQAQGIRVLPVVSSVALGKRLARLGVDGLIAEGWEAGGHIGDVSTMALVPQMVDAVQLPVIAAGGIADARGAVAAFALGASGVQLGTRFVCSTECTVHVAYKEAILKAGDRDAVVNGYSTGHPVRSLRNRFTRQFRDLEANGADWQQLGEFGAGRLRQAAREGDVAMGSVMAGQSAGLVKQIMPVRDIILEIVGDMKTTVQRLEGSICQS
jgi:enoyl-[acyl-carrier protein] reductase II